MKVRWLGHSCFLIEIDDYKVVTDPFNSKIGLDLPENLYADFVTVSHAHYDHNDVSQIKGKPTIIDTVGEKSFGNITFNGISSFHDAQNGATRGGNIIFKISDQKTSVCHLGDLGHLLINEQIEALGKVDILMVPTGGTYTIGPKEAVGVINQLNPSIIIPMHYQTSDRTLSNKLETLDSFLALFSGEVLHMDVLDTENFGDHKQRIIVFNRAIRP